MSTQESLVTKFEMEPISTSAPNVTDCPERPHQTDSGSAQAGQDNSSLLKFEDFMCQDTTLAKIERILSGPGSVAQHVDEHIRCAMENSSLKAYFFHNHEPLVIRNTTLMRQHIPSLGWKVVIEEANLDSIIEGPCRIAIRGQIVELSKEQVEMVRSFHQFRSISRNHQSIPVSTAEVIERDATFVLRDLVALRREQVRQSKYDMRPTLNISL